MKYMNTLLIHIYVGTKDMALLRRNLEIHWQANTVGVFGTTEKLSKIRLWLKDK
jgi:hypothetical protein